MLLCSCGVLFIVYTTSTAQMVVLCLCHAVCSVWPCWSYFTSLISVLCSVLCCHILMYSHILFSGI